MTLKPTIEQQIKRTANETKLNLPFVKFLAQTKIFGHFIPIKKSVKKIKPTNKD